MVGPKRKKEQAGLAQRASGPLSKPITAITVGGLERALLKDFPAADAEEWDRTGMSVGDPACIVKRVAVALDPTVQTVEDAADLGANVLVTHHPAYLKAPESFSPASSTAANSGALVWAAISRGVSLLSYHTSLDVSVEAQRVLPGMLNLQFKSVVSPLFATKRKGYGQLCVIKASDGVLTLGQLAARCTSVFGRQPRVWGDFSRELDRVVTCTGAAGDEAKIALRDQVDCLVCGEMKYHEALALSQAGLAIIELGHDTSELPLVAVLAAAVEGAGVPGDFITILDQGDNWSYPETTRV
ncbi:MAG: Nif3-like dinuclear metal center hexameric protein [Gordonibacter sp.]|nr:Nif3-like dinuclear metal center hexameric protein [Gordonibacter sp.]